jgi:hypothetical protein
MSWYLWFRGPYVICRRVVCKVTEILVMFRRLLLYSDAPRTINLLSLFDVQTGEGEMAMLSSSLGPEIIAVYLARRT